jgi:O-antigen/teichoic acid export membrane protein
MVFASLAFLLADLGLGASLVQRQELTEQDRSTAFWTSAVLGVVLMLVGIGLSWPLADLYRQPEVQPLFAVLSVTFAFTALGTTQGALLIRSLSFRSLEVRSVVSAVVSVAVGIVVALLGYGPWAIIAQVLAHTGISTALLWRASDWRPRFVFSAESLRHLLGYGGPVLGSNFVWYLERNADNFIVGRRLGPAALGAYGIAYNIMLVPILKIVVPIQQVFFPAMSRIRQSGNLGAIWLRMTRVLTALAFPALVGMAVVAPDFVPVVLGEKWHASIRVLQVLAWVGIVQVLAAQATTLLEVTGRVRVVLRYSIVSAAASVAGFLVGVHWGIVGVAAGYTIANAILVPVYVAIGCRAADVRLRGFVGAISGVVEATAGMAVVVLGLRAALVDHVSAGPRLVVEIAVGAVVFVLLCRWRVPEVVEEIRRARASRAAAGVPGSAPREG